MRNLFFISTLLAATLLTTQTVQGQNPPNTPPHNHLHVPVPTQVEAGVQAIIEEYDLALYFSPQLIAGYPANRGITTENGLWIATFYSINGPYTYITGVFNAHGDLVAPLTFFY